MEGVLGSKRILIVEDDQRFLDNLKTFCEMLGHKVVGTFTQACDTIFKTLPETDLILMDINLPGSETGVQFAKRINCDFDVPVIYITGNTQEEIFKEATESIMHGYLPKPITKAQLDFAIKTSSARLNYERMLKESLERIYKNETLDKSLRDQR